MNDILKLDLAELNFGVYRILDARRGLQRALRRVGRALPLGHQGQALAFVEPKGIQKIMGDAQRESKLDLLQELQGLALPIPTRGYPISATPLAAIQLKDPEQTRKTL